MADGHSETAVAAWRAGDARRLDPMVQTYYNLTRGGGPGIEVLVGMMGSGKSGYARRRSKFGAVVVCHDDLIRSIHPDNVYDSHLFEMYHRMEEGMVRAALHAGCRVVIDRTNLTRASRDRWTGLAEELGVRVLAVRFPTVTAEEHARRRFEDDPRGMSLHQWTEAARNHERQAERSPLSLYNGFEKIVDAASVTEKCYDPFDCPGETRPARP